MPNYKVINTQKKIYLVTDEEGFEGLIASHTAEMNGLVAAITAQLMRDSVKNGDGFESNNRHLRIELTDLPVNLVPTYH